MRAFKCIPMKSSTTRLLCALRNKNNQQLRSSMLELHSLLPSRAFFPPFFPATGHGVLAQNLFTGSQVA